MLHPYAHYLRRAAATWPDRTAVVDPAADVRLTWRELADRVARYATLLAEAGVEPGSRVLVRQVNSHGYFEAVLATAWRGATFVPVLGVLPAGEVRQIEAAVEPAAVIDAAQPPPNRSGAVPVGPADASAEALSQILFTSGTSGQPKGVMHTYGGTALAMGGWASVTAATCEQVVLVTTPMSHAAGRFVEAAMVAGGCVVIAESPKPAVVADAVRRQRVSHMLVVPTVLQDLVDHPELDGVDLSSLRHVMYASAPAAPSLVIRAHHRLGPVLHTVYGSTEAPAPVTHLSAADHVRGVEHQPDLLTSCGREYGWGVQIRILDEELREVPPGEVGQLALGTPWLARGYWRQPDLWTARCRDGWFLTGDVGRVVDGYLYLTDRRDDMIISGGFNVYPSEVEHVLAAHPAVREVAVFGVPDNRWGEAVVAAVSLRPGVAEWSGEAESRGVAAGRGVEALLDHCRERLARHKVPKRIVVLDDLPKSGHAKVSRRLVREAVFGDIGGIHGAE